MDTSASKLDSSLSTFRSDACGNVAMFGLFDLVSFCSGLAVATVVLVALLTAAVVPAFIFVDRSAVVVE